jgi:hypothetical protein
MEFDELIAGKPDSVQETARRLLAAARDVVPDAVESRDGDDYGVGVGSGYKGLVFVITPLDDRVRLGMAGGAALDDPAGLMQGRGKVHRHVRVADPAAADDPALRDLMSRAAAAARVS